MGVNEVCINIRVTVSVRVLQLGSAFVSGNSLVALCIAIW